MNQLMTLSLLILASVAYAIPIANVEVPAAYAGLTPAEVISVNFYTLNLYENVFQFFAVRSDDGSFSRGWAARQVVTWGIKF